MAYRLRHYFSGCALVTMSLQSLTTAAPVTFSHSATWGTHTTAAIYDPIMDADAPCSLTLGYDTTPGLMQQTYTNPTVSACTLATNTAHANNFFSPNVNVQTTGSWTATFTFTVTRMMTLNSVDLGVLSFSGTGTVQSQERSAQFSFDLKQAGGEASLFSSSASQSIAAGSNPTTVQLANTIETPCTLGPGDYVISLTCSKDTQTNGSFFGLQSIAFNGTLAPEPAAASLSLLGLATLAWRRRRK